MQTTERPTVGVRLLLCFFCVGGLLSCSTQQNTTRSRLYHSFTTRYNVYFNGNEAYKEGILAVENANKDNYMERIPFFSVGDTAAIESGKTQFERAIEKAQKAIRQHSIKRKPTRRPGRRYTDEYKLWLSRNEFNPFLHNAWMLMGKAQFNKGDFADAATTFSYIIRLYEKQPKIAAEARIWLAHCYTEMKWYYEAEDLLRKVNNDSLPNSLIPFYSSAHANLLLEQERYKEAVPYLQTALKQKDNRKQRTRRYYLLGQVYQYLQEEDHAYSAYGKVIKASPPYELELNARIRQTEVMAVRNKGTMINSLRRMTKAEKNKDYLDQIYYALGNIRLISNDTTQAIQEYLLGVEKSTRNGVEKGMLQLKLGNIFWQQGRFEEAQKAYTEAIALIDKKSDAYPSLEKRSEILDELVLHATAIQLQDSLQHLASLSEPERIRIIEKMMEEMARKEKEAQEAEERKQQEQGQLGTTHAQTPSTPAAPQKTTAWYFYNPPLTAQGKTEFERTWGRRKSEDNWRRKNKTVVSLDEFAPVDYEEKGKKEGKEEGQQPQQQPATSSPTPSEKTTADGKDLNSYLKQIPLTPEAMKESNKILADALYNLGLIFKDKLEDYPRAEAPLLRLVHQFPDFPGLDQTYYHLFLLYSRWEKPAEADLYKNALISQFPESRYALVLSDPDFLRNAMYGKQLEDSLYADTYLAYQAADFTRVSGNYELSSVKYPTGQHRPKFMFLQGMTLLRNGDAKGFLAELKDIVTDYPENEITDLAAHILKGVQEGRVLTGDSRLPSSVWERRLADTLEPTKEASKSSPFSQERETPYLFILAYEAGTVNEKLLLYEVARYNFSSFVIKNFDLEFVHENGIGMLQIRSFVNFNEARQYQRQLYANKEMAEKLKGLRALVISKENYDILMKYHSFDDYDAFYNEEMANDLLKEMSLDYIEFDE